jgi:hypothetical protein
VSSVISARPGLGGPPGRSSECPAGRPNRRHDTRTA